MINLLISIWTYAGGLVVLGAIIIGAIVEGAVPLSHRSTPPLVHKVPVEAREGSVLCAFALYKEGTLFDAKFLQVSGMRIHRATHYFVAFFDARVDAALLLARPSLFFRSLFLFFFFYYLFIYAWIEACIIICFILLLLFLYNFLFSTPLFESRTFLALTFILTFLSRSTRPARRALTYV